MELKSINNSEQSNNTSNLKKERRQVDPFIFTKGRLRRKDFWIRILLFVSLLFNFMNITNQTQEKELLLFVNILLVALIIIFIIQVIKRFRDLNKSGWYSLILLVPIVNFFYFLELIYQEGTIGANQYGPDPKKR